MKVLVVSYGEYSDYGFGPILIAPDGRNLEDDHAGFLKLFDHLPVGVPDPGPMPPIKPRSVRKVWERQVRKFKKAFHDALTAKVPLVKQDLGLPDDGELCWDTIFGAHLERLGYRKADVLEVNLGANGGIDWEAKVETREEDD